MKLFPRIGFFVLVTLLSNTSTSFSSEKIFSQPLSTTNFSTLQLLAQAQDVRKAKADQLQQQGIEQLNKGQAEQALKSLQQALIIYQEIKAHLEEGQTLKHLGNVYYSLENYTQAIQYQQQALKIAKYIKDRDLEWRTLNNIGLTYYWKSDYSKAIDFYQQSLSISRAIKASEGQAMTLDNLGNVYYEKKEYTKAIDLYQKSLANAREIKTDKLEAMALFHLGRSYDHLKEYGVAIKYFEQAFLITKKFGKHSFEGMIAVRLALAYEMSENYDKATEYYQISLTKAQGTKDAKAEKIASERIQRIQEKIADKAKADRLLQKGIKQLNWGNEDAAKQAFQQALNLYRQIGNHQGELKTLNNLGNTYQNLREFTLAIEVFEKQLFMSKEFHNLPLLSSALMNLQNIYYNLGNYTKSIEYGNLSLQVVQDLKYNQFEGEIGREIEKLGREMETLALMQLSMAYNQLGDLPKAIEYSQKNFDIAKSLVDVPRQGEALHELGQLYGELNNFVKAIDYLDQSLAIAQKINNPLLEAGSLQDLGTIYFGLGDFDKAKDYTEQARTVAQKFNHSWIGKQALSKLEKDRFRKLEQENLGSLGSIYLFGFGNSDQAIQYFEQVLKLAQESHILRNQAFALVNLGNAYGVKGNYRQAIDFYNQALAIERESENPMLERFNRMGEAVSLNILAYAYGSLGDTKTSLEYAQKGLAIVQKFGSPTIDKASALSALGRTYFLAGNLKESEKYLREAIKTFESVRTGLGGTGDVKKVFFSDIYADEYELLQQVLIAQNRPVEALEVAEQGRARAFVELLAKQLTHHPIKEPSITPPSFEQIKKIAQEQNATLIEYSIIHDASKFLIPAKIQGKGQNSESELFIWVVKPTGEVAFRRANIPGILQKGEASLKSASRYQLAAIPIFPWTTATIFVVIGSFISLIIWRGQWLQTTAQVLQNQMKHHPSRFWLSILLVAALGGGLPYFSLYNQQSRSDSSSKDLSQLGKAVKSVNIPNSEQRRKDIYQLLIQPIADLLPTDSNARVIFIPQGLLFYVPFPALQNPSGEYFIDQHTMLVAPSIQVLDSTHQLRQRLKERNSVTAKAQDILVVGNPIMPKDNGEQLEPLPRSEEEAKAIAALLKTQAITGKQATETDLTQRMQKARIIHLGTHGDSDENRGLGSWIALAPSDKDDGLLKAEEILQFNLNAEFVVLSACKTGRGRLTGDGMVGLSRSLISAGTPSVILTLWDVADETPTKDLMLQFYQELQRNPDKAQALRQAMLTTKKQYSAPKYWAAFTLIGEAE